MGDAPDPDAMTPEQRAALKAQLFAKWTLTVPAVFERFAMTPRTSAGA